MEVRSMADGHDSAFLLPGLVLLLVLTAVTSPRGFGEQEENSRIEPCFERR